MSEVRLALPDEVVDLIADRVAARLAEQLAPSPRSPWMTAEEAADYLRCPVSRVRKLTSQRDLPRHRDGARALYRREDLDAYISRGGASTGR